MNTYEQIWVAVAIGGFVLYMEAVFIGICNLLKRKIPEWLSRAGAGLLLLVLAIVCLKTNLPLWLSNLPPCLSWAVVGLLLLVLVGLITPLRRKKRKSV